MTLDMSNPAQLRRCASNIADEFPHWSRWLSECADDVDTLTAEVRRLREMLNVVLENVEASASDPRQRLLMIEKVALAALEGDA